MSYIWNIFTHNCHVSDDPIPMNQSAQRFSFPTNWQALCVEFPRRTMAEKILLIDDDRITLKNISHLLRDEGYIVEEAYDGAQALNLLDEDRFDLVLSDVRMPRVDGFGVLDHVRSTSPQTPVVFMTGDVTITRSDALIRGAMDYLLKPVELTELVRKIERALRRRRFRRYPSRHFQSNHKSRFR